MLIWSNPVTEKCADTSDSLEARAVFDKRYARRRQYIRSSHQFVCNSALVQFFRQCPIHVVKLQNFLDFILVVMKALSFRGDQHLLYLTIRQRGERVSHTGHTEIVGAVLIQ